MVNACARARPAKHQSFWWGLGTREYVWFEERERAASGPAVVLLKIPVNNFINGANAKLPTLHIICTRIANTTLFARACHAMPLVEAKTS